MEPDPDADPDPRNKYWPERTITKFKIKFTALCGKWIQIIPVVRFPIRIRIILTELTTLLLLGCDYPLAGLGGEERLVSSQLTNDKQCLVYE